MQSSSSVIKNGNVDFAGDLIVDTKYTYPKRVVKNDDECPELLSCEDNDIINAMQANIIREANQKASKIENQAIIEAEKVRKEAYDIGYKDGYEKAYNIGYDAALKAAEADKNELIHQGEGILNSCRTKYEKYFREHEKELIKCVIDIAEKVLHDELKNPGAVKNMIEFELEKIARSKTIIIKLNPMYYDEVNRNVEQWKNEYIFDNVFIIPIDDISTDEVFIEKDYGKIKISLSYALNKIKEELLK